MSLRKVLSGDKVLIEGLAKSQETRLFKSCLVTLKIDSRSVPMEYTAHSLQALNEWLKQNWTRDQNQKSRG